jgi:enamine deaminase RidA (YjgF/YER057c/UK114 family)
VTIRRRNPPGLHTPPGYHHVTIAEGRRLVFLAGQCPLAPDGEIPGDLAGQVDQVAANTALALADAGAGPEEVVRTVLYVASGERAELSAVWARFTASEIGAAFTSAGTLLGVSCLGFPGQLVELDVTAVL